MTDHIIKAAKAAGGTTYTNRHHDGTACAFGPEALERFYAIAYKQGMERAAEIAMQIDMEIHGVLPVRAALIARHIQDAIRAEAHAQNQTEGN